MLSLYGHTPSAADLLQVLTENSGNFYAGMRLKWPAGDRSCELQAQESLFNKTTPFQDNKAWPQINHLGAQWAGLSEGKHSRGGKLREIQRRLTGKQ